MRQVGAGISNRFGKRGERVSVRLEPDLHARLLATTGKEGTTIPASVRALIAAWVEDPNPVFHTTDGKGGYQIGGVDWWAYSMEMSLEELIGAILARAQVIEEFMRHYIAAATDRRPDEVNGTFGRLRLEFARLYPEETHLNRQLEVANEVRNEAAHSDALIAAFIRQVMVGHDPYGVDRLTRKGVRKSLYLIQDAMVYMVVFAHRNVLEVSEDGIPRRVD